MTARRKYSERTGSLQAVIILRRSSGTMGKPEDLRNLRELLLGVLVLAPLVFALAVVAFLLFAEPCS